MTRVWVGAAVEMVAHHRSDATRVGTLAAPMSTESQPAPSASASWVSAVEIALAETVGVRAAGRVVARHLGDIPAGYDELYAPEVAASDLVQIDALAASGAEIATSLTRRDGDGSGWRFRIYRRGAAIALAELLPLLDQLGLRALDERGFAFDVGDGATIQLHDVGVDLAALPSGAGSIAGSIAEVQRAFAAGFAGDVEIDGLDRLVLAAALDVRRIAIVRAYVRYLRQIGFPFSQQYVEATLQRHGVTTACIVELFDARFDPSAGVGREERVTALRGAVGAGLDAVASLDDDRILRTLAMLVEATTRTNAFRPADPAGSTRPVLAIKLDPSKVPDLPSPRPMFEIWVCSPHVEGVHLRGGPVARGGIRWSDRPEDFRTEILGLMKAQMVKNAVIVAVGAKGGFVVKRSGSTPDEQRAEGVACYRDFIAGLLDVTDDIRAGAVVGPPDTVRHDGDDPYLVVAADKGTASFSDIANAIAVGRGFWLGDAFASGGSAGYDHKGMAITARGAWESVRRHARVIGKDADRDELTVVGIGDMSGDVFGNGMLRSPHLQLVAAFDHRHVFLDPDPDPAVSLAERRRLFDLPRSSWADYDTALLSEGGAVHQRTAKSIEISEQARRRLGADRRRFTPAELVATILRAPVDLLWNGGIGTYVKASAESHADVGDHADDALRIDATELRCKMVGEGGNLGLTQRGRVEYALAGGLVNTDAIDNSAGVDCSDHEVNIKIALGDAVASGALAPSGRDELLASMSDEVAELVLDDNRAQTLALSIARRQSLAMVNVHARYLKALEAEGWLDRALEFLPTDKQIAERRAGGVGLTVPEFAVLLAYTKTANITEITRSSDLPDDPYLERELLGYFPAELQRRFPDAIARHRLRREIVATQVSNQMVNLSGISFDHRLTEDTGAGVADITRAWVAARDVFDFVTWWERIEQLGSTVQLDVQLELFLEARRMVERSTLWILRHRRPPLDIGAVIATFRTGVAELAEHLDDVLVGRFRDLVHAAEAGHLAAGVPQELAQRSALWPLLHTAFDVIELATREGLAVMDVARAYWQAFDAADVAWLWEAIGSLPRADRWQTQARSALRDDLLAALVDLADDVLYAGSVEAWLASNERVVARTMSMFTEIERADTFDLTTLSVALRQLRNLALTTHRPPA